MGTRPPGPVVESASGRSAARVWWWVGGLVAGVGAGIVMWRSIEAVRKERASPALQESGTAIDADPDLASGRM